MTRTPTCPLCAAELPSRAKTCPNCGELLPEDGAHLPLPPEAARASRMGTDTGLGQQPAGHVRRILAHVIDSLAFLALFFALENLTPLRPLSFAYNPFTAFESASISTSTLTMIVLYVLPLATVTLLEASRWQGTLGKYLCDLRVVDDRGRRLALTHSAARNVVKTVVGILGFLHLVIFFTRRRQGLHDMLARTYVVGSAPRGGDSDLA